MKRLVAVDLGASGGKCFAGTFQDGGFAMQEIHRFGHEGVSFFRADRTGSVSERTFWDDVFIYRNIVTGLRTFRREVSDQLDSIGIDTWGADGHFFSADGDMLGNVYCYRDHRLDNMIDVLKTRVDARRIYDLTGIHFQPFNLSNQLLWFMENRRELLLPGCFFLPVPSLFYYYLGGIRQVDSTWASVTQLMDARKKEWSAEVLDALGVPREIMPEIVEPGKVVGELLAPLADSIGINRAKLTAVGAHDTACAFAAAPVDKPEEALIISSGTWSLVGKLIPEPITSDAAMAANVSNEGGIGNIRCLKNCMGTWLAQELRRIWTVEDGKPTAWDDLSELASDAPAFGPLIDPNDDCFYNPPDMAKAIIDYCRRSGQTPPAGRGEMLRTVYESLAFRYRLANEEICGVTDTTSKVVHIVGGGSQDGLLNQFTADSLGMSVLAGPIEATAVGNFVVQALGLGIIGSMHDAMPIIKQTFPIEEYKPLDTEAWDRDYERFRRICAHEGAGSGQ